MGSDCASSAATISAMRARMGAQSATTARTSASTRNNSSRSILRAAASVWRVASKRITASAADSACASLRELPVAQRRAVQINERKRQQIVGIARLVVIADEAFGLRRLRTAEALACELCDALDERGLFLRMILTHVDSLLGDVHPLPPIPIASDLILTIVIGAANIKAARHRGAISAKMCASPHAAASGQ